MTAAKYLIFDISEFIVNLIGLEWESFCFNFNADLFTSEVHKENNKLQLYLNKSFYYYAEKFKCAYANSFNRKNIQQK